MDRKERPGVPDEEHALPNSDALYVPDRLPEPPQELPHNNPIRNEVPESITYEAFYRKNWHKVVNRTRSAGVDDPEDVASLTFLAIWQRWNKLDTTQPGPEAYLQTINNRRIVDSYRHRNVIKEKPCVFDQDSLPGILLLSEVSNSTDSIVNFDALARAKARLQPEQQELFLLLARSTPTADIARQAGISSATIRVRIFRLRRVLKVLLAEEGYHYD